ncbi:carbohydrate kinase family protein [Geminisphaera colitermitum]|uniref:carbohydrate kinase family protein n=1 Tax=Geminisphaera colitermitum TaxID=1148786 RepID=UPI000308A521|nr:PfkB family carbohydrate kinase [Geminisphaera colitermitum]
MRLNIHLILKRVERCGLIACSGWRRFRPIQRGEGRRMDLVGVGYCSWDYVCVVPEIPIDGKIQITDSLEQGGGPSATAIVAAQRLGARTAFVGTVGDDDSGRKILREFQAEGVDVAAVVTRQNAKSAVSYCWAARESGQRSIAWMHSTAKPLSVTEVDEVLICSARVLHLDGHQTGAAIHAARVARAAGVTVCLDAGTLVPEIDSILENVDIVIASETFAEKYTGEASEEKQLRALMRHGARWAVVTSGSKGSVGFDGKNWVRMPAFRVEAIDTTGAGDVYHGAFLRRYLDGVSLGECMRFASGAAALKCGALGGRTGIPTLAVLEAFLKNAQPQLQPYQDNHELSFSMQS